MGPVGIDVALPMAIIPLGFGKKLAFWGHSCSITLMIADWGGRPLSPVLELFMAFSRLLSNSVIALTP